MHINLVNTPCDHNGILSDTWYQPLGLVHIASFLEANGVTVKIVDGVTLGYELTLRECSGDLVGIAFNSFNIEEMEAVAQKAKQEGAFTVLGGHAASAMADLLIEQNRNIDAVVVGDGELAMLELVKASSKGSNLSKVPNLVYRSKGKSEHEITHSPRLELPIYELPIPRRHVGGLDPEAYIQRYSTSCSDPVEEYLRPTNVVTRKGCPRRAAGNGCSFCARTDRKVRARTPFQAWQEYKYLVEKLQVNYLYEDSDSWIDPQWLKQLRDIWDCNGGLDVRFRVYGDIRDITVESVELMKHLNVDTVLIGIESGDRNVLKQNGKDFSRTEVERACTLLADAGIKLADAYVLGLAGETWESIDRTIELSESVRDICQISATYWNIMLPLPGAPAWNMLLDSSLRAADFASTYRLNMDAVREEFFTHCTNLGAGALQRLENLRADLCQRSSMLVGEYIR